MRTIELHKLIADWGEGKSVAFGQEGQGWLAATNDATWRHRFYDTIFWTTEGGEFSATLAQASQLAALAPTPGVRHRCSVIFNHG